VDVSPRGDWSQVKVWYDPIRDLGNTVYPTYGFIYQTAQNTAKLASMSMAQTAGQMASAAQPTTSAGQTLANAAALSTDRIAALIQSIAEH